MKSPFLGLRTCIYRVSDLQKAKAWYAQVFETKPYFDEPFYVGFNIGGFELGLQPEDSRKGDSVLCFWGVNKVEETFQKMLNLGASAHENPQNVGGEIVVATVKDPWENIIGIIYNPEFKIM